MSSLKNLDWDEIIEKLQAMATSEAGRLQLAATAPLSHQSAAESKQRQIAEAQTLVQSGTRCFMESLDLYSLWFQRLQKDATLKTLELKDVRHFLLETIALKETLKNFKSPWLSELYSQLFDATEPLSAIDQLMTPEGDIRNDASEDLYKLFRERDSQVRAVQNILDRLARDHQLEPVLQERYVTTREGRWVLPVKSGMQHHFEGIIHSSSQSKQTVFMEPKDIIPLNNRLRQIEVEIEEEIERLLTTLSKYLATLKSQIALARETLLICDVRLAEAQLSQRLNAQPPTFQENHLHLIQVRHPLLALNNPDVVTNTVHLDPERRILLLSGPNAGGKTVLLKAVGLAAHMARCGLMICAEPNSTLPFFAELHVSVGDAQSVDAQLSTFAAHLKVLNEATQVKGPRQLLLIDEICGSTDPEEGSALARSFIETYSQNGVFAVITSHLGPLKLGWKPDSGVINGSLEYDQNSGRPTYQFLMGVPGQSLAIQTARRVGVDAKIVARALDHLSPTMKHYQLGMVEVEAMKADLQKLKADLERDRKDTRAEKSKLEALTLQFENEKQQMLEKALRSAEKKIETLIEHSKVEDVFKRHEKLSQAKLELPEIVKAKPTAGPTIQSAEEFIRAFPPGSKVFATQINRDAVIQGKPNSKGEVPILANSMRLMIPWQQLKSPEHARNPTPEVLRQKVKIGVAPSESDRVVDVRGLSVDEAIQILETQLDTAALHQEDRVKVVHGHGTETLKRGVRNYLSRSVYVKKWRVGTSETGGDGVTWAELKDN